MHKKVFGRKLSRGRGSREALFRSLIRALVINDKIETTKAKAKSVQGDIDKLITWVKRDSVVAKREVLARVGNDREIQEKLFVSLLPRVDKRTSGFTRIVALPTRAGDRAQMVRLEWIDMPAPSKTKKEAVKKEKENKK